MSDYLDPFGRTVFTTPRADGSIEVEPAPGQHVCDFCLTPGPTWEYPCGPVALANPDPQGIQASYDDWATCDRCHELIEAASWTALISHCVETQGRQTLAPGFVQLPRRARARIIRHNLREFLRARQGEARPYTR